MTKKPDIGQRLGLLANSLGLDPTGANSQQGASSAFTDGTGGQASGRVPQGGEFGGQQCCYDRDIDLSIFGITCINPQQAHHTVPWTQGCSRETATFSNKQCGTRSYDRPASGLAHGEASPGEFPWTCLLLNQNNDFIGSCAIIPNDFSNDNTRGTRKVITAAHKLKKIGERDLLKVRVGEYDASGFNDPEIVQHEEYTVTRLLKHDKFNPGRLDNDIAILYVA